jgi:hypothetical protein
VTALAIRTMTEPRGVERRRHGRVKINLPGQFMRENRKEFPCLTIDASPGGIAFSADVNVDVGEKIIVYLSQIGRVQGVVARLFQGGFAISMKLPPLKREKLAEQLTWLANRQDLGMPEDRRHERIQSRNPHTTLTLPGGKEYIAKIIDVSRSGVALSVATAPPVGTPVAVGATRGQIVRIFAAGVAVEFTRVIPEDAFSEDLML